jgi:hypothetical protein
MPTPSPPFTVMNCQRRSSVRWHLDVAAHLYVQLLVVDAVEELAHIHAEVVLPARVAQMLLQLLAAAVRAAADQAAVGVKDQPAGEWLAQCIADRVLHDAVLQVRGLDQPGLGVIDPELKVRPGPVRPIQQFALNPGKVAGQVALIAQDVDLAAFALLDLLPSKQQCVVVSDLRPKVAEFVGHGETVA